MSGSHAARQRIDVRHRVGFGIAPEAKVLAVLVMVGAIVATRREAVWAFVALAGLVLAAAMAAYVPLLGLMKRLSIEVPFVAFAVLLPFLGRGERVDVLGIGLSRAGLWGAWNIVAKGTLGVACTVVLVSVTTVPDLLKGLERLRAPRLLTAIAAFMIRYGEVIRAEAERMRIARVSRCDDARYLWQAKALAGSSGVLFVRSYERGERVHLAMLSRGFTGEMPELGTQRAGRRDWQAVAPYPLAAVAIAVLSWVL